MQMFNCAQTLHKKRTAGISMLGDSFTVLLFFSLGMKCRGGIKTKQQSPLLMQLHAKTMVISLGRKIRPKLILISFAEDYRIKISRGTTDDCLVITHIEINTKIAQDV